MMPQEIEHLEVSFHEYVELLKFIGVSNLKDAKQSITGLRERIKFTQDYETLKAKS